MSAVPRGSCTGTLLFILYANDLPEYQQATNIKVSMFADDTYYSMTFSYMNFDNGGPNLQVA